MPVLYVFGRGDIDVKSLASMLLSGPLSPPTLQSGQTGQSGPPPLPPVLLLYDVTYAYAVRELLELLGDDATRDGRLVVGFPTPQAYSPLGRDRPSGKGGEGGGGGCGRGPASVSSPLQQQQQHAIGGEPAPDAAGVRGQTDFGCPPSATSGCCGAGTEARGCGGSRESENAQGEAAQPLRSGGKGVSPAVGAAAAVIAVASGGEGEGGLTVVPAVVAAKRRVRIGGLGVELDSEEALQRHVLVFVGGEGRQLSNIVLRCAGCVDRIRYDPVLPAGQRVVQDTGRGNKDLMRR